MDENQYRPISDAEFAAKLGIREDQLSQLGDTLKRNSPLQSSPMFRSHAATTIDQTAIHGTMELIEQLRNCEIELQKANTANQKIALELKSANEKIAVLSTQLETAHRSGRFPLAKGILIGIVGTVIGGLILNFIILRLGATSLGGTLAQSLLPTL